VRRNSTDILADVIFSPGAMPSDIYPSCFPLELVLPSSDIDGLCVQYHFAYTVQ
jgi:hypothetical protein